MLLEQQIELCGLTAKNFEDEFKKFISSKKIRQILFHGDSRSVLKSIPDESIDFIMTSPPYWGKREYDNGGIGLEKNHDSFIENILDVTQELKRTLKNTGSFWLNMGDTYINKCLPGIPWRIALKMIDDQGWILRNSIIWNKLKGGMDNSHDRLGNAHENIFHFVKKAKGYYYNVDAIRSKPRQAKIVNGSIVSATGVSGVRYKRQIELSTSLTDAEKANAFGALQRLLDNVASGVVSDFRMVIRGQQRTTHSNSEKISGRAKELNDKGFYFLKYHPKGSKPNDVWDIIPEDRQKRETHSAVYPVDLCRIPILATCPPNGVVLDPFCGSGTTLIAAAIYDKKSIGIDISKKYLELTQKRLSSYEQNN